MKRKRRDIFPKYMDERWNGNRRKRTESVCVYIMKKWPNVKIARLFQGGINQVIKILLIGQ